MQKLLFIFIGLIFLNTAKAQKNYQPCGYAFSTLTQPGTMPVDENGVPVKRKINKERFVYIILPGKIKPAVKTVAYNNVAVKWDVSEYAENEYAAVSESTQKTMRIKAFKGGTMWRLTIQEFPNHAIQSKEVPIVIKGNVGAKPFTVTILKETAVQGYETY